MGRPVLKGMSWGPSPETKRGKLFERDDFMSEAAAPLWAPWGRGDLHTMSALGANAVRLYGLDFSQNHTLFLNEAHKNGLGLITGMSDYPYLQMEGNCRERGNDCYTQIFDNYLQVLNSGFAVKDGSGDMAYHPAMRALIVINEPEIGKFNIDRRVQCKVVASAMDGILEAEKNMSIVGNPIALTVAYSFAGFYGKPGLGQMRMLYDCMMNIEEKSGGYKPRNDVKQAFVKRFINSFNTHNNAPEIRSIILNGYGRELFWTRDKIPVFIGEYHASSNSQRRDLPDMLRSASDRRYPYFLGYSYFEFQARYDKLANWQHEMTFGMYGFDFKCEIGSLVWWGGGPSFGLGYYGGNNYTIYRLVPRPDVTGYSQAKALAEAFGGNESKVDYSCKKVSPPADFQCYGCWSPEPPSSQVEEVSFDSDHDGVLSMDEASHYMDVVTHDGTDTEPVP